jgi:2-hydroxychromene-2-carboxylate isomerase
VSIEFWFEFASTYSYPAAMRLEAKAAERGVAIQWRPFLLGPIFRAQGWRSSPFIEHPHKGEYMWRDVERICDALHLPFRKPSQFPRGSVLATRVACRFAAEPWLPTFVRAIYRANFELDHDIGERDVVAECLQRSGQAADTVIGEAERPESKQALRDQTDRAARLGVFGAPFFIVGTERFWGNDRLEQALDWATSGSISP